MLYSNDVFCWSVLLMVLLVAGCSFVDGGVWGIFFFFIIGVMRSEVVQCTLSTYFEWLRAFLD